MANSSRPFMNYSAAQIKEAIEKKRKSASAEIPIAMTAGETLPGRLAARAYETKIITYATCLHGGGMSLCAGVRVLWC